MKIALIGASGGVGARVLKEATARGHQVTAIARDAGKVEAGPNVTTRSVDLADQVKTAEAIQGHDAVVVSVRHQTNDVTDVVSAAEAAGVKRVLIVGGAGSLMNAGGVRLLDTPDFPDSIRPEAAPAAAALEKIRANTTLDWTFLSPPIMLQPGQRTGKFRKGLDNVIFDDKGGSNISHEDLAVAILDELEKPEHIRQRFTVGY